jgi:hypothetical protein
VGTSGCPAHLLFFDHRERNFLGEAVLSWESVPAGEAQIDDADQHRSAALDPACQHRPTGQPRS